MHNCVILCVVVTTEKKKKTSTTVQCRKTGFSPTKVDGIACCDHKMSSASSLSPYQAVCCTELSPLALGTGHTSCHPPPHPISLFVCLSLHRSFYPGAVTHPSSQPRLPSLSPPRRSASIVSVRTGGLSVDKAAGLQKTHQTTSRLCAVRELRAQQKDRDSTFSLRPLPVSTTWPQTGKKALEDAARITSYKHEPDQLKPFETRAMFSDCFAMTVL